MRIRVTEIEATPEDLRQSQSLSASVSNALRRAFVGIGTPSIETDDTEEEEDT